VGNDDGRGQGAAHRGRRDFLQTSSKGLAFSVLASILAGSAMEPAAALAQAAAGNFGPKRKAIWIPQAAGDWNIPIRAGQRDFCAMVGWDYQYLGNPVYSVENHVEQINNAISASPDVIVTELESVGMVPAFQKAIASGIQMIIIDQGVVDEAAKLKLGIIGEDGFVSGYANGTQGATFAQKLTGKADGMIVFGNGNPGAALIDARQAGSQKAIQDYNQAHGANYQFTAFPDSSFDDEAQSIQKYTAQMDQYGDSLVAMITGGNVIPIVKAMQERGFSPGKIAAGSVDLPPAHQQVMQDGWIQWGTDQQQYLMGLFSLASAFAAFDGYSYPTIRTGEAPLLLEDLPRIKKRTDIWLAKARAYGDIS
jgi:ABC-type sugar transport system substrate-binding protein